MFQFPGFAPIARYYAFSIVGCPIRTSADQFVLANPRSFSQLITSFFASESLGILHTLLLTSFDFRLSRIAADKPPMCSLNINKSVKLLLHTHFLLLFHPLCQ